MPRISLDGFKDPVRRPRYILWTFVIVLAFAAILLVTLGITSTRWFCSEGCHKVQDDTITAYTRSTHAEISCMACHMPVSANPVVFMLHKAEALGELYLTVTDNFELPLNGESEVSLTMVSGQCTQCHNLAKRKVTPTRGIIMKHEPHEEAEVTCAICHNRIAHVEDFELTLEDPATKEPNARHEDFMTMTACFRCHSQGETPEGGLKAPGACEACHTASFELKPASHLKNGFFPKGHAELGQEEASRVAEYNAKAAEEEQAAAAQGTSEAEEEGVGPGLIKVEGINECNTCHSPQFCSDCHGLPMPHPVDFMETHAKLGSSQPETCAKCHGDAKQFCDECHHGTSISWQYDTTQTWKKQHPGAVQQTGASACFKCHDPTYCAKCHVSGDN